MGPVLLLTDFMAPSDASRQRQLKSVKKRPLSCKEAEVQKSVCVRREADETTGKDGEMHTEFPAALGELVHEAFDQCFSHCFTPRST